jgi:hypothetical protein
MPSDTRTARVLTALTEHRNRFRSAVAAAHDQMAGYVAAHRARTNGHSQVVARELGRFAAGRIDSDRFGALFAESHFLSAETTERVERLVGVLAELLAEGDELFTCEVPAGGDLRAEVDRAIAHAGRVFGTVLAFQALKTGVYRPDRYDPDIEAFPFARWNRSERLLGLPLVVEVSGADVRAESLAGYVDGWMAIVLVVRGTTSPAPLVRLITPGTFVIQTGDVAELDTIGACGGPAVAAVVNDTSARFVHDPRAARSLGPRLTVAHLPAAPKEPLGGRSAWQQAEELAQLQALQQSGSTWTAAASPASPPAGLGTAAPVDAGSIDRLAGWLLSSAGLSPIEPGSGGRN